MSVTSFHRPEPARPKRTLGAYSGYLLVFAYLAIVAASLLLQRDFAKANRAALGHAQGWSDCVHRTAELTRHLGAMEMATVWPANSAKKRAAHFAQEHDEFSRKLTELRAEIGRHAVAGEQPPLLQTVAEIEETSVVLAARMKMPPLPPGAEAAAAHEEAVRAHFKAASASLDVLHGQVRELARAHFKLQADSLGRIEYLELGLHALLLLTIGGTTMFLYRIARRMRSDVQEKRRLSEELQHRDMKYRSIFDHAIEGIFQTTPEGRFITANNALARMYGYQSPEHLMQSLSDIGAQLYVDRAQREALLKALQAEDVVSNFEFEAVRADGRTIWLRENVRAVRDHTGKLLYMEGTVEDVSDRWWAEQRRLLHYGTARVLAEAASVAEARPKLLETICETLEWDMGAVWDVDQTTMLLRCMEIWHAPEIDIHEFEQANVATTYALGSGLAGEVWQSGEPKWIANIIDDPGFPNAEIAVKAGMGSAFGVPIKVAGEVRHVLEFFSPKITLPDPELLQTLGAVGSQLGHLIERKNAEEALRKSEVHKAAILWSALDCIISFDTEGRVTEFNPAAERTFGYTREQVLGEDVFTLLAPESVRERYRTGFQAYQTSAEAESPGRRFERQATRNDGSEVPIEIALSRILVDGTTMFTAYVRDITERRNAERITSELAAVVENSNDAIIACTLSGEIHSWNAGAERIYGYTANEAVGRPLHMIFPPDRLDEFPEMLTAVKSGQSLADHETVRLRKDGKKISVSLTDSPILSDIGEITGLSSIARDITERKRLEEDLLQSQKMDAVGRLAGGIAHDFNNALTAILGYSDLIIGQIDEKQWMYKHLCEIRKASDFASSLTHQLLAFSRRQPLYPRVLDFNDTVTNLLKMLQRVIGEHVQVVPTLSAEPARLKADPGQLEQVLLNLCVNARDAMPGGGRISISTENITHLPEDFFAVNEMPAGEYVKLVVADTGSGIDPEIVKHIFEPFFTTKEAGHGTGLGLATCYGIVKQSGGYITVESILQEGTTFTIYLPRVEEDGEKASLRNELSHLPPGTETILYVEDEITVRSLTAHVLRRLGYTVLEAVDGKSARDLAEAHEFDNIDLLFCDVVLPDAGGKGLSEWFRQRRRSTRILFTSGYVDEAILRGHGLEDGTAFLQKPFAPSELARKVREIIDGKSGGAEALSTPEASAN